MFKSVVTVGIFYRVSLTQTIASVDLRWWTYRLEAKLTLDIHVFKLLPPSLHFIAVFRISWVLVIRSSLNTPFTSTPTYVCGYIQYLENYPTRISYEHGTHFKDRSTNRDETICLVYKNGGYTMKQIADYFWLHCLWISWIVRKRETRKLNTRSDHMPLQTKF